MIFLEKQVKYVHFPRNIKLVLKICPYQHLNDHGKVKETNTITFFKKQSEIIDKPELSSKHFYLSHANFGKQKYAECFS